ncbi:unnamed protein product [Diplocarpon coronariae]
MSNSHKWNMEL